MAKFFSKGENEKINLQNVGFVRQYPYGSKYNIEFDDDDTHQAVMADVRQFKEFGGGSIVENTTYGIHRNLELMYQVASQTGVNVVAGTGHYLEMTQKPGISNMTLEELTHTYTQELLHGSVVQLSQSNDVVIKCGFIGEVGSVYPISNFERRAIQATAEVQSEVKCGVSFHPGRDPRAPFEIVRIYLEAGGDAKKCVMSHLDRTLLDDEKLLEFSNIGCYCQLDLFGTEVSWYQVKELKALGPKAIVLNLKSRVLCYS